MTAYGGVEPGDPELKKKSDIGTNLDRTVGGGNGWRSDDKTKMGSPEFKAIESTAGGKRTFLGPQYHSAAIGKVGLFLEGQSKTYHGASSPRSGSTISVYCQIEKTFSSSPLAHYQRGYQEKGVGRQLQEPRTNVASKGR